MSAGRAAGPLIDALALVFIAARIAQTAIHVLLAETGAAVGIRFGFFAVQIVCMVWMGVETVCVAT